MTKIIYLNKIRQSDNGLKSLLNYFKKLNDYNEISKVNIFELKKRNKNLWNVIKVWEKKNKSKLSDTQPEDRPKEITDILYRIISNENLIMNQIEIENEYWKEN